MIALLSIPRLGSSSYVPARVGTEALNRPACLPGSPHACILHLPDPGLQAKHSWNQDATPPRRTCMAPGVWMEQEGISREGGTARGWEQSLKLVEEERATEGPEQKGEMWGVLGYHKLARLSPGSCPTGDSANQLPTPKPF